MVSSRTLTLQAVLLIALAPSLLHASPPAGGSAWSANANRHRGQNGQRFTYSCPAGGALYRIWGTDVYTDDSSVCTAAVHAGLIVLNTGGNVTIEIRPGQDSYTPSTRNRVRSDAYGPWTGSFVFTGERSSGVRARSTTTDWNTTAANHRGHIGQRFSYSCPGNGEPGNVWGSGQSSYRGSTSHRVESKSYGAFSGSFMFLQ
jgi:hypothetical protein